MRISDWSSDVCSSDLDWRNVDRRNFPLPGAVAFFDDLREELENGSGMVKLRGLDVSRYSQGQLRRIWYGLGCHLGTPMYQNRSEEHTSELQSLMRISYAVFCLKKKKQSSQHTYTAKCYPTYTTTHNCKQRT